MINLKRFEIKKQFTILSNNERDKIFNFGIHFVIFSKILLEFTAGEYYPAVGVKKVNNNLALHCFYFPVHDFRQKTFVGFHMYRRPGLEIA